MAQACISRSDVWASTIRSASRSNIPGAARGAFAALQCLNAYSNRAFFSQSTTKPTVSAAFKPYQSQMRSFSSTPRSSYKTVQEAKSRAKAGPFSLRAGVLFLVVGAGLIVYFRHEKERIQRQRIADQTKGMGRPKIGGPFELVNHNGKRFTAEDLRGKYALVYFGFTHCPDICPEELDKMAEMIDQVKEVSGNTLRPIFITCDPARDTPAVMKTYLAEFHPDIIGLTGSYDAIKAVCKAYRVYFSTPPDVKPGQDYLVDHSIYFYLMDPEGDFVEALGRNEPAPRAAKIISDHIGDWRGKLDRD